MRLREAQLTDASHISALISVLAKQDILPSCSESGGKKLLESMSQEAIEGYLAGPFCYHLMEDGDLLVGVIGMRDDSHLYHLFVAKTHQGQGIGTALWCHAKNECLAKGNTGRFTVNSALNAQGVYLKLGFLPLGAIRETQGIIDIPMELVTESLHNL
ncbi:GNAT family N-acetyltransferase [Shewanella sp. SR44-3]|uniref:GNAT family N-acetyltransferase n=1 Tax=Shewanella sp. SR44-3 TaxID=2760936 RepID=UPI0015FD9F3E|nr:GNAT family N-acetyltransferase [Shewanella sp. SR44-3]MBB1268167.1 GNAT family N-acetyltransferase [Shewanella sp. SR44-3]